jgi:hypothetical protein
MNDPNVGVNGGIKDGQLSLFLKDISNNTAAAASSPASKGGSKGSAMVSYAPFSSGGYITRSVPSWRFTSACIATDSFHHSLLVVFIFSLMW